MLHVDVDEFVAAVEVLRRPELRGLPVVVGGRGDATKRGAVATANYEARRYGVHSGMALRTAARKCPEAVFLPADREAYEAASEQVMQVLSGFTDALEVWGWDEAFLEDGGDPESVAATIQRAVREATGLSCSVGIGDNKLRAKTASSLAKPAGIYLLTGHRWPAVMGDRGVEELWGIGKKTARRLAELGIATVHELGAADPGRLAESFGPRTGPWLVALARGEDSSPVSSAPRRAKSRSLERTFDVDVSDLSIIGGEVDRMAKELASHAASVDRLVSGVTVKIRLAPFTTRSRSMSLDEPCADHDALTAAAAAVLSRFDVDRPVRLVGVKVAFQ